MDALLRRTLIRLAAAVLSWASAAAHSQDVLRVLADTPLRPALVEIGKTFHAARGVDVVFVFGPSPVILKRLEAEAADAVVIQEEHIRGLAGAGKLSAMPEAPGARVGLGLAVSDASRTAPLADAEALRSLLLDADQVIANKTVAGDQFLSVVQQLGVEEQVRSKLARPDPTPAMYKALSDPGVRRVLGHVVPLLKESVAGNYLGPLPDALQRYQVYSAGVMNASPRTALAADFVRFLSESQARRILLESGAQ